MPFDKRQIPDQFFEVKQYLKRKMNNADRLVLRKQETSDSSQVDN